MTKKEPNPDHILCKERMPENDRCILIFAPLFFGKDRWQAACWLGEDKKKGGKYCWAINGEAFTKKEINATHWMEMPDRPGVRPTKKPKK